MRILVIDDVQENRDGAMEQLKEHELTVVGTVREARHQINTRAFDVILTDMMMPGENDGIGGPASKFIGEATPYGLAIVMIAMKRNIPVVIVTLGNHHQHPIFWALDDGSGDIIPGKVAIYNSYMDYRTSEEICDENCSIINGEFVSSFTRNGESISAEDVQKISLDGKCVKNWKKALEEFMK